MSGFPQDLATEILYRLRKKINNIPSASCTAQRQVRGGYAPRKAAFTLAEVLITLGIIGVVAAMTLPTLIAKYQEKVMITRLKKVYSVLSQVYTITSDSFGVVPESWPAVYREVDGALDPSATLQNVMLKSLRSLELCTDCQSKGFYFLNGTLDGNSSWRAGNLPIVTPDGTTIRANWDEGIALDCSIRRGTTNALKSVCFEIMVDLNSQLKPNTYGRDVFVFYWTKYGIVPTGGEFENYVMPFSTCSTNSSGYGCAAWVLFNDNMDYLHCSGLSWNGKKTCK